MWAMPAQSGGLADLLERVDLHVHLDLDACLHGCVVVDDHVLADGRVDLDAHCVAQVGTFAHRRAVVRLGALVERAVLLEPYPLADYFLASDLDVVADGLPGPDARVAAVRFGACSAPSIRAALCLVVNRNDRTGWTCASSRARLAP